MNESCSICGFAVAWCVDPDDKGTYWLCGECATSQVMETFLEKQALLRVARAAVKYIDETPADPDIFPEQWAAWLEYLEVLKELPEGLLD